MLIAVTGPWDSSGRDLSETHRLSKLSEHDVVSSQVNTQVESPLSAYALPGSSAWRESLVVSCPNSVLFIPPKASDAFAVFIITDTMLPSRNPQTASRSCDDFPSVDAGCSNAR